MAEPAALTQGNLSRLERGSPSVSAQGTPRSFSPLPTTPLGSLVDGHTTPRMSSPFSFEWNAVSADSHDSFTPLPGDPPTEDPFSDMSGSTPFLLSSGDAEVLVRIMQDPESTRAAIKHLIDTYSYAGRFCLPSVVKENIQMLRAATQLSGRHRPNQTMAQHTGRFWGQMQSLGTEILLSLPPLYDEALRLPPERFFSDVSCAGEIAVSDLPKIQATRFYQYTRRIQERQQEDKVRFAVAALVWQRIIQDAKHPEPWTSTKRRPRLTKDDVQCFLDSYFFHKEHEPVGTRNMFLREDLTKWFNNVRDVGIAYSFLCNELGPGALFHIIPHFTQSQIVRGLARSTDACREGLAYLRDTGLPEDRAVLKRGENVEHLVGWMQAKIASDVA